MTPPAATSLMSHTPCLRTQINNIFPFIYSCIITAANCFVNGTVPSASPVNTMSLEMLIILLFAWPGALERRPFPWFNYCGLGSGENEGWTLKPPVLMTFKLITATCCYGVDPFKREGNEKRSSPLQRAQLNMTPLRWNYEACVCNSTWMWPSWKAAWKPGNRRKHAIWSTVMPHRHADSQRCVCKHACPFNQGNHLRRNYVAVYTNATKQTCNVMKLKCGNVLAWGDEQ